MFKSGYNKISFLITLVFLLAQIIGIIPTQPVFAAEPSVQLNAQYYKTGSTVIVTVTDATANTNASAQDTITVNVKSTTDASGITVELAETEVSTGIFAGVLTLAAEASDDGSDKLRVSNGDTITVTYNNGTYTATDTATVDDTPPGHVSHDPASDAMGVIPGISTISVTFNEPIKWGSDSGKISIVDHYGNHVNIASKQIVGSRLELTLYSSLAWSETYTVTVPAGAVEDLAGNQNSPVAWSFKTVFMELDRSTYKPYDIVTVTLYDSARGSESATVKAKCPNYASDPIYVSLSGSGGVFRGVFSLSGPGGSSNDNTLGVTAYYGEFIVSYDPDNDGTYEVVAAANVDSEAPKVSATSPQDGAADVAVDAPITITFSEPVQPGDQFNYIEIKDNDGNAVGGISCIIEGSNLTVNHDDFQHSTGYTLYLPTDAVRDAAGNMYNTSNFAILAFTTQAVPPREIHIAPDGSDNTGDGSQSNPYKTIGKAVQAANDGDTIIVHDGTYNESVVVTKDVTITSVNGPGVTSIQPAAGDGFAIQPASGSYGTRRITGFTITGASHGISVSGMSGGEVYLENNMIYGCGDGIYIDNHSSGTVYVRKNTISGNTGTGIKLGTNANGDWVEVKWNNIVNNSSGIVHNGSNQLDAPLNFWGNSHGPSYDGINHGNSVNGSIDFQPWLVDDFTGEEITTELSITSPTLAEGYPGLEYFTDLPVQSNTTNVQWSLYSGSLPGGINIVSGRALYGQPASAGSYSFALEASDGTQAVYKDVFLNVAASYTGSGPAVVTRSPVPYEVGAAVDAPVKIVFNEAIQLADNHAGYINIINTTDPYDNPTTSKSIGTTNIPNDTLIIDHSNLSPGTLYKVSLTNNVVMDTDSNGFNTEWYFTTAAEAPALEITTVSLPDGTEGASYSTTLEATGGGGNYTWSLAAGSSLPGGLSLSPAGVISGTPAAAGTYNFTVQVVDQAAATDTQQLSITIHPAADATPPAVVQKTPENGAAGVLINAVVTVKFDEPIQAGDSFANISITPQGGTAVTGGGSIDGDTLTINHADFTGNAVYTVTIPSDAVKDMAGNPILTEISWSFTTGKAPDVTAPVLTITQPLDSDLFNTRVTITGTVQEENLREVEVAIRSVDENRYWDGINSTWVSNETWNTAPYSGSAPDHSFQYMAPGEYQGAPEGDYIAYVRAHDYSGNMSATASVNYSLDFTKPNILNQTPANNASDVAVDVPITITFDEDVVANNLGAIYLEDLYTGNNVSAGYNVSASFNEAANTLVVTHDPFAYEGYYALRIPDDVVRDSAGNGNDWIAVSFRTAEEGDGGGDNTPIPPSTGISVFFEDGDADGIYYYRPGGQSDTLTFSLSGLSTGLNLGAQFGALSENGEFTVTGAVYGGWITGEESGTGPGVYIFSVDIDTPDNNNYQPLAIELSGLPSGVEIPPFVLVDSTTNPTEPRVAMVNINAPQPPEGSGLKLLINPALDTVDNLHAIPGVSFTMQHGDGTKIGTIAIGSADNPLDFLALDDNGVPELAKLQQTMEINADMEGAELAAGIDTRVLTFLAGKDATITFYNVSETLGLELSEDNFRDMLKIQVFDNNNEEVSDISQYINLEAITYSTTGGEGYNDKLVIPVDHFTTYKITPLDTIPPSTGDQTPALTIKTASLPDGAVGENYSVTFQATGGTPPYTWSITSGNLPDGLRLNSVTGEVYGTPATAEDFEFTATVTDAVYATASQLLSISILGGGTTPEEDTTPPSVPSNLCVTARTTSSITIAWDAFTDESGIAEYIVEMRQGDGDFAEVGTTTNTTFTQTGLSSSTTYFFRVRAKDTAGNVSDWSGELGATTRSSGGGGGGTDSSLPPGDDDKANDVSNKVTDQLERIKEGETVTVEVNNEDEPPAVDNMTLQNLAARGCNLGVNFTEAKVDLVFAPEALLTNELTEAGEEALVEIGGSIVAGDKADEAANFAVAIGGRHLRAFDFSVTVRENAGDEQGMVIHKLNGTVTVTLDLSDMDLAGVNTDRLAVFHRLPDGTWEERESVFDLATRTMTFTTDSFSLFAVMEKPEKQKIIKLTIGQVAASVDGNSYTLDAEPYVNTKVNRTLVPVRFVSEAFGARIDWVAQTRQVEIKDGDKQIILIIGSNEVLVNGERSAIDCALEILPPGRTFVPLRFVSETLGAKVDYNHATKQITIIR